MLQGVVKRWEENRGFGFIKRDDGQGDTFVHVSNVLGQPLREGQRVTFDDGTNPRTQRPCAVNVQVVGG